MKELVSNEILNKIEECIRTKEMNYIPKCEMEYDTQNDVFVGITEEENIDLTYWDFYTGKAKCYVDTKVNKCNAKEFYINYLKRYNSSIEIDRDLIDIIGRHIIYK